MELIQTGFLTYMRNFIIKVTVIYFKSYNSLVVWTEFCCGQFRHPIIQSKRIATVPPAWVKCVHQRRSTKGNVNVWVTNIALYNLLCTLSPKNLVKVQGGLSASMSRSELDHSVYPLGVTGHTSDVFLHSPSKCIIVFTVSLSFIPLCMRTMSKMVFISFLRCGKLIIKKK